MIDNILAGARVKLLALPEWLVHDLPAREQAELRACIGQVAVVQEIDSHGYFLDWLWRH